MGILFWSYSPPNRNIDVMQNNGSYRDDIIRKATESVAKSALDKHIANKDAKEWYPSDIIPFEEVKEPVDIDSATISALYIHGLTEDNLAHYTATLKRLFGREGAWGEWNNRWTWEESLHGRAIERYMDHLNIFDKSWLEKARKAQLTSGNVPEPSTISEISIYTSIQEELTRIAHSRLSQRLSGVGRTLFALIAGDENRHHKFYVSVATSIRQEFPDDFMTALHNITKRFDMPGLGIPGYKEHAEDIERAGIFTSQDVARTIGKIASQHWAPERLIDEVGYDENKQTAEKLLRRLEVYKRIGDVALNDGLQKQPKIIWLEGRPVYN